MEIARSFRVGEQAGGVIATDRRRFFNSKRPSCRRKLPHPSPAGPDWRSVGLGAIQKAPALVREFVCRRGRSRLANVSRKKQFAFDNFVPEIVVDGPRAGARLCARFAEQFIQFKYKIWQ
jgi:hypothetical protein